MQIECSGQKQDTSTHPGYNHIPGYRDIINQVSLYCLFDTSDGTLPKSGIFFFHVFIWKRAQLKGSWREGPKKKLESDQTVVLSIVFKVDKSLRDILFTASEANLSQREASRWCQGQHLNRSLPCGEPWYATLFDSFDKTDAMAAFVRCFQLNAWQKPLLVQQLTTGPTIFSLTVNDPEGSFSRREISDLQSRCSTQGSVNSGSQLCSK